MNDPKEVLNLLKIKWAALLPIPPELLEKMTLERHIDLWHNMGYERLKLVFWGEWAEPTVVARYPSNWKEAVKERFAPAAYLKKHPVIYTEIKAQGGIVFPHKDLFGASKIWRYGNDVPNPGLTKEE